MNNDFNEILADLYSITPLSPNPTPRLVDRTPSLQDQITQLAYAYYLGELIEKNSLKRKMIKREVSTYYYKASIRVYNIFESLGIQQIFQTTNTTLPKIN
ncbi:7783_t:CDS:2, partial [Racocetra persica]